MFDSDEKKDNIEKVEESLYSKTIDNIFVKRRHNLQEEQKTNAPTSWNVIDEEAESHFQLPYSKILLGAFIFFVLALGFTFSKFFLGSNIVSGNNIDILVSGPVSIAGGEELPLDIQIINNNNVNLNSVSLKIEYPAGTKSSVDQSQDYPRYSESLGDINIGKSQKRLVKSVLFGEENSQQIVKITVEYRTTGSNAIFSKEKDFNVLISSSPVNVSVSAPTEINSNQLTDFSIDVSSNSTGIVKNLILKAEYPFGFNLSSSNPKSISSDGSVFAIGDLAPGAKRTIRISGAIAGQDGEQRVIKFTIGIPNNNDNTVVATPLASYVSTISLKKSSIGLDVAINQQSGDNLAIGVGNKNTVDISWKNNLPEQVYDMTIKIQFNSQVLDKNSVDIVSGYYNSADNSIIFDKGSQEGFSTVNPSDQGDLQFSFRSLYPSATLPISFGNSSLKMDISVVGSRAGSNGSQSEELLYSDTKTLKLSSVLRLLSRGFRTIGPFENSGPFPPQVDNQTTYTITWTASDSFNNITGAKVSAFLPPNVTWTGYTSPDSETITYDKGTGEVDWNLGDMRYGVGNNLPARTVSFQVAITPSITQVGQELNLLNEATISGTDVYSGERIGEVKSPVTTTITSDPEYVDGVGIVVR